MKILMRYYWVIILLIVNFGCTTNELVKEDEKDIVLKKEDVLPLIENKTWGLIKIEKQIGSGSKSELPASPEYTAYKTQCSFAYSGGYVGFYSGNESTSDAEKQSHSFPAYARTFSIFTRISLPVGLDYSWDESSGTLMTHCYDGTKILKIPLGQTAYLDKTSLILYKDMATAQASKTPENITLVAKENDASQGVITYYYSFRPLYPYKLHTTQWENDSFVMF